MSWSASGLLSNYEARRPKDSDDDTFYDASTDDRWKNGNKSTELNVGQFHWFGNNETKMTTITPKPVKIRLSKPNTSFLGLSDSSLDNSRDDSTRNVIQALRQYSQKRTIQIQDDDQDIKRSKIDHHHNLYMSQLETDNSENSKSNDKSEDIKNYEEFRNGKRIRNPTDVGGPTPKRKNNEILSSLSSSIGLLEPNMMYLMPVKRKKQKKIKEKTIDKIDEETQVETQTRDECVETDKRSRFVRTEKVDKIPTKPVIQEPVETPRNRSPVREREVTEEVAKLILMSAFKKFAHVYPEMTPVPKAGLMDVPVLSPPSVSKPESPGLSGFQLSNIAELAKKSEISTSKPLFSFQERPNFQFGSDTEKTSSVSTLPPTAVITTAGFSFGTTTTSDTSPKMTPFAFGKSDTSTEKEQVSKFTTDPPKFMFASNVPTSEPPQSIKFGVYVPTFGATTTAPTTFGATTTAPISFSATTTAPISFSATTTSTFGATTASKLGDITAHKLDDITQVPKFGLPTSEQPSKSGIQPPKFGATTTAPSTFGATTTAPTFGSTTTAPTFGSTTSAPSTFGSTTTAPSTFGATTTATPTFGGTTTATPTFGGTTTATPTFGGTTTASPTFGGTTTATPTFGTSTAPPIFGSTTTSTPTFGATTTTAPSTFSTTTSSAFGGKTNAQTSFGASTTASPTFGAKTTAPPTFGGTTTAPPTFGGTTTAPPTFGATTTAPTFGATTTAPTFGATTTSPPTFASTTSIKFGGTIEPPKFGANITEPIKFGAEPNKSVFGGVSTSEVSKRVFGATEAPKFGSEVSKPLFGSEAKEGQPTGIFAFRSNDTSKPNFNFGAKPEDKPTFQFGAKTDAPTFSSFNTTATTTAITTPTVTSPSKQRRPKYDFNFSDKRSQERAAVGGFTFKYGEPPAEDNASNIIIYRPGEGPNPNPPPAPAPPLPPVPNFGVPNTFTTNFANTPTFQAPAPPFGQSPPAFGSNFSSSPSFGTTQTAPSFGSTFNSNPPSFGTPASNTQTPFAFGQTTAPSFNFNAQSTSQPQSGMFQFGASSQNQNTPSTQPFSFNAPGAGGQMFNIGSGNTSARSRHTRGRKK